MDGVMAVERDGNRLIGESHTITRIMSNNKNNNVNSGRKWISVDVTPHTTEKSQSL